MLKPQEHDRLREVLQAEKQRLLKNAQEGLTFAMNRDRNIGRDSIDESMEEELFSTELRLRDREKWLLGKINAALERLEAGTIDECEDCGELIDYRRLVARPVTTLCIDCKEEREKEEQAQSMAVRGTAGASIGGADESGTPDESTTPDE
jgi:DnaK suppressor protein